MEGFRRYLEFYMLEQAQRVLKDIFGYDSFRGRQGAIIERVANGGDALVLMPTGGGKSLCFQVPALLRTPCRGGVAVDRADGRSGGDP